MNIGIEARSLSAKVGGVQNYTRELLSYLTQSNIAHQLTVIYADREKPLEHQFKASSLSVPLRHPLLLTWWLNRQLPAAVRSKKFDLLHFTKADVPSRKLTATVVTIFDVIPLLLPETQSMIRRWYWPQALRRASELSDHIITISQASKKDIMRLLDVPPEKITVTPLAIDRSRFRPQPASVISRVKNLYKLERPYILFVGTRDWRKNISSLISAFDSIKGEFEHDLVIAGRAADKRDGSKKLAASLGLPGRVKFIDFVPARDLPALYGAASLFVWPSVYEGWGLPPLEAMACGVPVIVSNGGSLPEVAGNAAEVVKFSEEDVKKRFSDTQFVKDLGLRMLTLLSDAAARTRLTAAGMEQAASFSWAKVAAQTMAVYERYDSND